MYRPLSRSIPKIEIQTQTHTNKTNETPINFPAKDNKPVDADGSQVYTDEKLSEIIDHSIRIMDTDFDGYVSFPEFVQTQENMKTDK